MTIRTREWLLFGLLMFSAPFLLGAVIHGAGSGGGAVTSVDASGGVETASGAPITGSGGIRGAICIKREIGTTYTVLTGDRGCLVTFSNANPVSVTLPDAGTTGFETKFYVTLKNIGTGLVTVTAPTSMIDSGPDVDIGQHASLVLVSDGTDYETMPGAGITAEVQGLQQVGANGKTDTTAVSFTTAWKFLDENGDGWALYTDPTTGPKLVCVDNSIENGCTNYNTRLASGQSQGIQNSAGTDIFRVTNDTSAITGVTLDAEGTGNTITLKRYRWFPGAGCSGATASTIWNLPSTNPAVAACRTGTNTTKGVLNFADGANALTAQLEEYLHEDWVGAIDATIVWQSGSTSTNNVVWQLAVACAGAGESDDPTFTDDIFTADANNATANTYNATPANLITTTGTCAAGELMHVRVKRDPAHASDTLVATAQLVGVSLKLREAQ